MKKAILFLAIVGLMFSFGTVVNAGDYHDGASLVCNQCHTMHARAAHDYGSATGGFSYTPAAMLLKGGGSANDLCLTCHDNGVGPDVMGTNDTGSTERSAGALNKVGGAGGSYAEYMGHTINSTATAPGGTFSNVSGLSCVDCHSEHGSDKGAGDVGGNTLIDNYRNLKANANHATPTYGVSYAAGTNDLTRDIFETGVGVRTVAGVNLNEPNTNKSGIGEFCKKCHEDLHGDVGGAEVGGSVAGSFIRHPAAGIDIGGIGGGHSSLAVLNAIANPVRIMNPDGVWGSGSYTGNETPTCLSCHRGHGNGNSFGLVFQAGTSTITEDGDGTGVKDLCKNCHVQGS